MNQSSAARLILAALGFLVSVPLLVFLATGFFDYLYIRHIVAQFDHGLADVDLANPKLMKALVAGMAAAASWWFLRFHAVSMGWIRNILSYLTTVSFGLVAVMNLVSGIAIWGHHFDGLGNALLRYEITPDNRVLFYAKRTVSPRTGLPLQEVTPEAVYGLEARRQGAFREVTDPRSDDWFGPGTGQPLLWFSERPDGIHVFNMPGYDPDNRAELRPVSLEIKTRYYHEKHEREQRQKAAQASHLEEVRVRQARKALPVASPHSGERFPATRLRPLSVQETASWTVADLRYAINEMFARHGAVFSKAEIQAVFANQPWYQPRNGLGFNEIEEEFTAVEKQNLLLLASLRDGRIPSAPPAPSPSRSEVSANPQPTPKARGASWHINLLPNINVSFNGASPNRPRREPPFHQRCRTHHYPNAVCPATGRRQTF